MFFPSWGDGLRQAQPWGPLKQRTHCYRVYPSVLNNPQKTLNPNCSTINLGFLMDALFCSCAGRWDASLYLSLSSLAASNHRFSIPMYCLNSLFYCVSSLSLAYYYVLHVQVSNGGSCGDNAIDGGTYSALQRG